jgi:hypothetical protein
MVKTWWGLELFTQVVALEVVRCLEVEGCSYCFQCTRDIFPNWLSWICGETIRSITFFTN